MKWSHIEKRHIMKQFKYKKKKNNNKLLRAKRQKIWSNFKIIKKCE